MDLDALADPRRVAKRMASLLPALASGSPQHARGLLVSGIALNRAGQSARAKAQLLDAVRAFDVLDDVAGRAEALCALATAMGWGGEIDHAILHYSLALADWAALGRQDEVARVLVLLGRLNLEAKRYSHALEFFKRAQALSGDAGADRRRLEHFLGQCLAGLERHAEALARFDAALAGAAGAYLRFVAARDAALAAHRLGDAAGADRYLGEARRALPDDPNAFEAMSLRLAEAEIALDRGDTAPVAPIEDAVAWLESRGLSGPEISARIVLARTLERERLVRNAERQLASALRKAQAQRLAVHAAEVRAAMGRMDFSGGVLAEERRAVAQADTGADGYVLRERLGTGAFGTVFRAFDVGNARDVALKELRLARVYEPALRERLLASARVELEAASRVRHPGVARVYALNHLEDDRVLLVQEYVPGESLRARMDRQRRPAPEAVLEVLLPVLHAVSALHAGGVIHRDLKPDNVVFRADAEPVLVDFGIAHVASGAAADPVAAGTPAYMAPEQARGSDVDARADLYAIGVIAYEWLAGALPILMTGDAAADHAALQRHDPEPLVRRRPDLPEALCDLVDRLLHKRRWRRPDSAAEVAERLAALRGARR